MEHLSELEAGSIKGALEALLLVSSDPVSASQLAGILGSTPGEIASLLADLKVEYEEANRGFQLREVAGVGAFSPIPRSTTRSSPLSCHGILSAFRRPPSRRSRSSPIISRSRAKWSRASAA